MWAKRRGGGGREEGGVGVLRIRIKKYEKFVFKHICSNLLETYLLNIIAGNQSEFDVHICEIMCIIVKISLLYFQLYLSNFY